MQIQIKYKKENTDERFKRHLLQIIRNLGVIIRQDYSKRLAVYIAHV